MRQRIEAALYRNRLLYHLRTETLKAIWKDDLTSALETNEAYTLVWTIQLNELYQPQELTQHGKPAN